MLIPSYLLFAQEEKLMKSLAATTKILLDKKSRLFHLPVTNVRSNILRFAVSNETGISADNPNLKERVTVYLSSFFVKKPHIDKNTNKSQNNNALPLTISKHI
jgi:hypothetical protein